MSDLKYQSCEWVEIQKEMYEDENKGSIMDEFIITKEKKMNILKEASKRVEEQVQKLTINELIKIDLYTFKNELMSFYIKEIQKELKKN